MISNPRPVSGLPQPAPRPERPARQPVEEADAEISSVEWTYDPGTGTPKPSPRRR